MNPQCHLTPLKQLQSTLTALRELYNNRNAVNTNLPWGQPDGCCFGVAELQGLLTKVHREVSKLNNHDPPDDRVADVTRRIHEAMTSTDPVREMAAVVRWATDVCIDFLYLDPKLVTAKARWGLEIMEDVKNRLHAYWSEVSGTIERNDLWDEYPSEPSSCVRSCASFFVASTTTTRKFRTHALDLKNSF
jgi:hypothetical protein